MNESRKFCFKIYGDYALFSDPITRVGGEKLTYDVPTYDGLRGIAESIYWKPTFRYIIDAVRIINPIRTHSITTINRPYNKEGNEVFSATKLVNPMYEVLVEYMWDESHPELANDRDRNKHDAIMQRSINKGGRRSIFLGTSDCYGYVEPCVFGETPSFYDSVSEYDIGLMYHSLTYPDHSNGKLFIRNMDYIVMKNGIIKFNRPEDTAIHNVIKEFKKPVESKRYENRKNFTPVEGEK